MTIADVANFAWVNWAEWAGIDVKPFRHLSQWLDRINERPAVKRGLDVPEPFVMKEKLKSKVSFPVFQRSTAKGAINRRAKKTMPSIIVSGS